MVVHKFFSSILKKNNFRHLLAVLFLFLLVAEWGSHAMMCCGDQHTDEFSISSTDYGHDDPCQTLVICQESRGHDPLMSHGHEMCQHNGLLDTFKSFHPLVFYTGEPKITFSWADRLFRPPSSPFHPPKLT